jgi:serine/threonine protein kinase
MEEATAKVDIWALGVILYQLLASRHPFIKDDHWQTMIAIKDYEPTPLLSSIREDNKRIVKMLL